MISPVFPDFHPQCNEHKLFSCQSREIPCVHSLIIVTSPTMDNKICKPQFEAKKHNCEPGLVNFNDAFLCYYTNIR